MFLLKIIFPKRFHQHLDNKIKLILIIAVVCRFFLMAYSIHPDFFFIHVFPNLLVRHNINNIYNLFSDELSNQRGFYYTPSVLYFFSAIQYFFQPINNGFQLYMDNAYTIYKSNLSNPLLYLNSIPINYSWNFFLMKSPYLLFDFGILLILLRLINSWNEARKAFYLWIFSPMVLYGAYSYGQFDIIPTFLLMFGIFLCLQKRILTGILMIGLASTFKNFALLAVIPAAICFGKNFKEKFSLSIEGFTPFLISYIIVYLQAPSQAIFTIFPRFYLSKLSLDVSTLATISKFSRAISFIIIYLSTVLLLQFLKINQKDKIIGSILIIFLALFSMSPIILFHYTVILMPFLIIYFIKEKWLTLVYAGYILTVAVFKLWTPIQQLGLFAPINNKLLTDLPSTSIIINKIIPYHYISLLAYVVFFILSLTLIIISFKKIIFESRIK